MSTATFENHFFDPLQLIIDGHESKELKAGEEYEGQAGSYSVKLNDLEIFSINYGGVSALTIQLFQGRPRPPLLEVRNKTASQLHIVKPGEKSAVVKANGVSASEPRLAGKFSINHGSSEGFFFARQNVNIVAKPSSSSSALPLDQAEDVGSRPPFAVFY